MITPKLERFISEIYNKSHGGYVNWEVAPDENSFQSIFPNRTVVVASNRNGYFLKILNEVGQEVSSTNTTEIYNSSPSVADTLERLFSIARDSAFGVDKILDELTNDLVSRH